MDYEAPWWLPGGHAQTIWPALYARRHALSKNDVCFRRERWTTPDGDFIDVDRHDASDHARPLMVMFHGLEGSSASHYAQASADWAAQRDINWAMPHFRGCSGEINHAPRAYHSGDHQEVDWILRRFRHAHLQAGGRCLMVTGVSLGGNALMRWAAEQGDYAAQSVDAIASVCSPLDLMASGVAIGRGVNRQVYTRMFLRTMKPKAMAKWAQYPGLFDRERLQAARDLYEFDNVFTAPVHGFMDAADYWRRASAKPMLDGIRVPALLLNACNDPLVPVWSLPRAQEVSKWVTLWQPPQGGHVGFARGPWPADVSSLPEQVGRWLLQAAGMTQQQETSDG